MRFDLRYLILLAPRLSISDNKKRRDKLLWAVKLGKLFKTFFELLIAAAEKYTKKTTLRDADIKFFLLKRLVHIALRRRYISIGQYENLILRFLLPIGKQLGGWIQNENS